MFSKLSAEQTTECVDFVLYHVIL